MKRTILILLFQAFLSLSYGQLKEFAAVDSIFAKWDKTDSPGCSLGIIQDGDLVYARGYGMANLEYDIPNSKSSVFRIGSTSKQFTAACIVLLAEQGRLSLDDTLNHFFPEFPDYAEKITIRHLLNHTSGIRDYLQIAYLKGLAGDDYYEDGDIMKWLVQQSDLNFKPGDSFLYSNSGYWLLGQIVQKVSGENMADFALRELFTPLDMTQTHFHNDHTQIVKNRASGYVPKGEKGFKISMTNLDMIGDGGIFTSIEDIKKWDDAYYDTRVLSKAFWDVMTQQGVLNDGEEIDYASGLFIETHNGLPTISHGGAFVGFRAELLRFPQQKLTIAIFANRGDANPSEMALEVADILLKEVYPEVEVDEVAGFSLENVPDEVLPFEMITGIYQVRPGLQVAVSEQNDSLKLLQTWNETSYIMARARGNTFQVPNTTDEYFSFSEVEAGKTQVLTYYRNGGDVKAQRKNPVDTSGLNLEEYVGEYYSKELDATYFFELANGELKARIEDNPPMDCSAEDIDQFLLDLGLVRFQRSTGNISGFQLDSGRVKNLKFEKQ
jgi:CubicO group peptidase (beta-lactamase class C family)